MTTRVPLVVGMKLWAVNKDMYDNDIHRANVVKVGPTYADIVIDSVIYKFSRKTWKQNVKVWVEKRWDLCSDEVDARIHQLFRSDGRHYDDWRNYFREWHTF